MWVGCVVFFVVAETAARQLEVSCLVVGCVGGWGGDSFTVCCFPVVARVCVWLVVVLGFLLAARAGAPGFGVLGSCVCVCCVRTR